MLGLKYVDRLRRRPKPGDAETAHEPSAVPPEPEAAPASDPKRRRKPNRRCRPAPRPAAKRRPAPKRARGKAKARAEGEAKGRREAAVASTAALLATPRTGWLDALGFFLLAGLVLSWPRSSQERRPGLRALFGVSSGPSDAHAEPANDAGRGASNPLQIPPRGWGDILARTWSEFNQDRILSVAAGVTFFTLLSLFPALGAFVSLYGLFADVGEAQKQLALLAGVFPRDTLKFIGDEITRIAGARSGGLGVAFVVSLLLSLWSANGAVKALFDGLNVAYEEHETRGFIKLNLITLGFTLGALAFLVLAFLAVIVAPVALRFLGMDAGSAWLAELRWPVIFAVMVFGLSILYRYGPSRTRPHWRWITPGGIAATLLWLGASVLFSYYVANFAHYDKTYGSLGAVVGFMTWIWYSTTIVLFGAELNCELEHQTGATERKRPIPQTRTQAAG